MEGLLAGRLDAALVDGPAPDAALEGQPWFEERLVLITGLELGPVRSPADVAGRPVFGFRAGCSYRRYLDTWYAAAGVPRRTGGWRSSPTTACGLRDQAGWR